MSKPEQILYNSSRLVETVTTEEDVGSEVIHLYEVGGATVAKQIQPLMIFRRLIERPVL